MYLTTFLWQNSSKLSKIRVGFFLNIISTTLNILNNYCTLHGKLKENNSSGNSIYFSYETVNLISFIQKITKSVPYCAEGKRVAKFFLSHFVDNELTFNLSSFWAPPSPLLLLWVITFWVFWSLLPPPPNIYSFFNRNSIIV